MTGLSDCGATCHVTSRSLFVVVSVISSACGSPAADGETRARSGTYISDLWARYITPTIPLWAPDPELLRRIERQQIRPHVNKRMPLLSGP
jgi:hypothetical protein